MADRVDAANALMEKFKTPIEAKQAMHYIVQMSSEILSALESRAPNGIVLGNRLATWVPGSDAHGNVGDMIDFVIDRLGPVLTDLGLTLTENVTAYQYGYVAGLVLYEIVEWAAITAATLGWGAVAKGIHSGGVVTAKVVDEGIILAKSLTTSL